MSNSAISFNTAGLASATSPGLVGTGAQTFAGKKTLDGGALIKGDTSGSAIASGYVGQVTAISSGTGTVTPAASGVNKDIETLTLTAGVWLVNGAASVYWQTSNPPTGLLGLSFGLTTTLNGTPTFPVGWAAGLSSSSGSDNGLGFTLVPIVVVTDGVTNNVVRAVGNVRYTALNTLVFDLNQTFIQAVRIA